jgi:ABC-type branched-subunit amino acid transport system ATPase component/branched-subunit amino acid ABC-type transport system permease component
MDKFVALLIGGAVSGAVYSLVAVGLVLTYTTSKVFNFAQGAVAFVVTLCFYELTQGFGWGVVPAFVLSVLLLAPGLGLAVYALVFRRLADAEDSTKIVATIGLSIALPAIALFVVETAVDTFGVDIPRGDNILFPPGLGPTPKVTWTIGPAVIDSNQLIALVIAVAAAGGLWFLLRRTRLGLRMRATVDRRSLAETRGVDAAGVSRIAFALSFAMAGLAGVGGATFFSLTPSSYTAILVVAAGAAVLGGLRSIPLAFLGGIVLGLAQSFFAGYVNFAEDISGLSSAVPYVLLFAGLFLLGRDRSRVAGTVAEMAPADPVQLLPRWRRALPWAVVGVVLCVVVQTADAYWLGITNKGLAMAVIFLSFVVVTGVGGMVSLAQATFVLFASLLMGRLLSDGVGFAPALVIGVLAVAALGALFALPALRLGGLALALSTLALALIGETVLFTWPTLTNRTYGWTIPRQTLGPIDLGDDRTLGVVLVLCVGLVVWMISNLRSSPSGRAMLAVRSSEAAAGSVGLSAARAKLRVFAVSAAIAGFGGILLAIVNRSVTADSVPTQLGLTWLAIVVLMGIRRPAGALLAAFVFVLSPEVIGTFTESTRIEQIFFGLGAIQLASSPDGVLSALTAFRRRRQRVEEVPAEMTDDAPGELALTPARAASPTRPATSAGSGAVEPPVLRVDGLTAGYGEVEVLHGVDLVANAGEITVLLGANGAGKSTLCAAVAGTVRPTGGTVVVGGTDVTARPAHRRTGAGIAYAPESRGIFPGLTVAENLALSLPDAADRDRAFERFPQLADRRDLEAGSLSGGEQQMLALAPVIVHPPKVLLADEPSLGLAPLVVEQIFTVFRELRDAGTAVVLVEEKATHVLDMADSVVLMSRGRTSWAGAAGEVDLSAVADSYLEVRR